MPPRVAIINDDTAFLDLTSLALVGAAGTSAAHAEDGHDARGVPCWTKSGYVNGIFHSATIGCIPNGAPAPPKPDGHMPNGEACWTTSGDSYGIFHSRTPGCILNGTPSSPSRPNAPAPTPVPPPFRAPEPPPAPAPAPALPPAPAPAPAPAVPVAPSPEQAIQDTIKSAAAAQILALATRNPAVMADTATSDFYADELRGIQLLLDDGVTAMSMGNHEWGPITVSGNTATAEDWETWTYTYADGRTEQADITASFRSCRTTGHGRSRVLSRSLMMRRFLPPRRRPLPLFRHLRPPRQGRHNSR